MTARWRPVGQNPSGKPCRTSQFLVTEPQRPRWGNYFQMDLFPTHLPFSSGSQSVSLEKQHQYHLGTANANSRGPQPNLFSAYQNRLKGFGGTQTVGPASRVSDA